jgi:hypothetical protein
VLAADDGLEALKALAGMEAADRPELHVWRAPSAGVGEESGGSSAAMEGEGGVEWITSLAGGAWVCDTVFDGAGHSVHNTVGLYKLEQFTIARKRVVSTLETIK